PAQRHPARVAHLHLLGGDHQWAPDELHNSQQGEDGAEHHRENLTERDRDDEEEPSDNEKRDRQGLVESDTHWSHSRKANSASGHVRAGRCGRLRVAAPTWSSPVFPVIAETFGTTE